MPLDKIWCLRADTTWARIVSAQADEAGRSSPSEYIRDLVWTLAQNPPVKTQVLEVLQGVRYEPAG
jgi:hypothetical protein